MGDSFLQMERLLAMNSSSIKLPPLPNMTPLHGGFKNGGVFVMWQGIKVGPGCLWPYIFIKWNSSY